MVRAIVMKVRGQGLVEYGLLLMLIMLVVIAIITIIGSKVSGMYTSINSGFVQ
jgi:pilus assembly protein Flp/PilA